MNAELTVATDATIADAFIASCRGELLALKPGNVHVYAPGHGMTIEHFLASAEAAAPALAQGGARVGRRIREAVDASFTAAGLNTNLGILLLCAPLAAAAERRQSNLRSGLLQVITGLDKSDAEDTFAAIARASPGGLGRADQHDVHHPATVSLLAAMREAAARDRIALQYTSNFEDVFVTGLDALSQAREKGHQAPWSTVAIYFAFLAKFPDTHIERKFGRETAEVVRREAVDISKRFQDQTDSNDFIADLLSFDTKLKSQGLNPGTSADLTVATLFADRLSYVLPQPRING